MGRIDNRIVLALIVALGLALRIAAAQGALWLDEAWSAVTAHAVGTPMGVFLKINHDNNHHLNTLWLQLVGPGAPPLLQRALSIVSGSAAIGVAWLIGLRVNRTAGLCAALLFAVSPLLVTYGAEARGYAPMVLALLVTVLIVARWLEDGKARTIPLALTVLLGMFSQLTMAFALMAITLWVVFEIFFVARPERPPWGKAAAILAPLLVPAMAAVALVLWAAGPEGLQFGSYDRFAWSSFNDGVTLMWKFAFGGLFLWLAGLFLVMVWPREPARGRKPGGELIAFGLMALVPAGVALLQLGNSGTPRYYLVAGIGWLTIVAIRAGERIEAGGWQRIAAGLGMAAIVIASLAMDWTIIRDQRADPELALTAMRMLAPEGTTAAVDQARASAVLEASAASTGCPAARFLFVDRDGDQPFPDAPMRCGAPYRIVTEAHPHGLSGTHWKLYERVR
jgi:Dolichyl-phosphate-mannose-protein mannosyltransferase